MATIAFDTSDEPAALKPPISGHPAFAGIVALWFAALLGLGSFVLPAALLEYLVGLTGLPALLPAANPPLGFTARAFIAIVAALGGAGFGLALARRVARAQGVGASPQAARSDGSRRPIDAQGELGSNGVASVRSLPISRRRALAISEDEKPGDALYQPEVVDESDEFVAAHVQSVHPAAAPTEDAHGDEPLDLHDLAEEETEAPLSDAEYIGDEKPVMSDPVAFPRPPRPFDAPDAAFAAAGEVTECFDAEPLRFVAPSLSRNGGQPHYPELCAGDAAPFRTDWQDGPLEELGLVQLVQRLGSSLERRRELMAQAAAAATAVPLSPLPYEPAPADDAAQAMAAYFGSAPRAPTIDAGPEPANVESPLRTKAPPAMLRPDFLSALDDAAEEDEDEGIPYAFSLSPRPAASDEEREDDDGYGSLLGMSKPPATPKEPLLTGLEDAETEPTEEAGRFYGETDASDLRVEPAVADEALRKALATLQKMSGTA